MSLITACFNNRHLEKIAEEPKEHEAQETPAQEQAEEQQEVPKTDEEASRQNYEKYKNTPDDVTPATGNKNNYYMDPSVTPGGLKAQEIKDAISEAIQVGQSDKILPFIKALAQQYPDTVNEIIKMVKIELHDGLMKKMIDEQAAVAITDQLNNMVGEIQ